MSLFFSTPLSLAAGKRGDGGNGRDNGFHGFGITCCYTSTFVLELDAMGIYDQLSNRVTGIL